MKQWLRSLTMSTVVIAVVIGCSSPAPKPIAPEPTDGLNLLVAWGIFLLGDWFGRLLGQGGLKAVSKVFSLLLAAIAVTMILHGLELLGIVNLAA